MDAWWHTVGMRIDLAEALAMRVGRAGGSRLKRTTCCKRRLEWQSVMQPVCGSLEDQSGCVHGHCKSYNCILFTVDGSMDVRRSHRLLVISEKVERMDGGERRPGENKCNIRGRYYTRAREIEGRARCSQVEKG